MNHLSHTNTDIGDIGDVKIRDFLELLAHPVETPWLKWVALCQNVHMSVPYIRDRTWRR